jgi:hypothetical protein
LVIVAMTLTKLLIDEPLIGAEKLTYASFGAGVSEVMQFSLSSGFDARRDRAGVRRALVPDETTRTGRNQSSATVDRLTEQASGIYAGPPPDRARLGGGPVSSVLASLKRRTERACR